MSSVSYEITDKEVIDSYWYMMKSSGQYRNSVLKPSLIFLLLPTAIEFILSKSITSTSIIIGVAIAVFYPFFLVHMARKMAKKGFKSITLTPDGMTVSIANNTKIIEWKLVSGISESDSYLFIVSSIGNFMCIPKRAFVDNFSIDEFKQVVQANA